MEARAAFRGARVSGTIVAAVLVIVALGVGAIGGYLAANLGGSKAASPRHVAAVAANVPNQSEAVLPGWLVQEMSPKTGALLRQDDPAFIARYAAMATLPGWLAQEITPQTSPRLRQDDPAFIARYAAMATLPGWLVQEITPQTSPRLRQDDPEFVARQAQKA